jgi:hypothetical protein
VVFFLGLATQINTHPSDRIRITFSAVPNISKCHKDRHPASIFKAEESGNEAS